jgi:hypothetical protein
LPIIITDSLALSSNLDLSCPYLLWRSLVTDSNITASVSASAGFPLANLGNPLTHQMWEANTTPGTTVVVTMTTSYSDIIDGVGIAGHNFGSQGLTVTLETTVDGSTWVSESSVMPANDNPLMFRITPGIYLGIRFSLTGVGSTKPRAAVWYVHKLGRSTGGAFLGQIVVNESRKTKAEFKWITSGFYRESVDPFIKSSQSTPFFFAWAPSEYPADVGYCWMLDDPVAMQDTITRRFSLTMNMQGIA